MAARCLPDDVRVDAEVRRVISGKLLKLYFDFKLPRALRKDIRQVFARLRGTTIEKDVLEALIERLTDPEGHVRQAAAEALGQLGTAAATPEVMAALLKYLTDPERHVRQAAAEALRNLLAHVRPQERPEVMKLFLPLTRSRDADSREMGYVGLRNLLAGEHAEAA